MTVAQAIKNLRVRFGRPDTQVAAVTGGLVVDLAIPLLAGCAEENLPVDQSAEISSDGNLHLLRGQNSICGAFVLPAQAGNLEAVSQSIFNRILDEIGDQRLYRVWNYVPHINAVESGLENYHRFNIGRWKAFSQHFGSSLHANMPAASAVGILDPVMVTIFSAGRSPVRYVENPQQIPAWRYPEQYGPKSPSFSRGARCDAGSALKAYISGTASIKGHETVGKGNLETQIQVTCENLRLVASSLDLPDPFSPDSLEFQAKVYLRHAADLDRAEQHLSQFGSATFLPRATFLLADICRQDLDIEIELTYA